MTLIYMIGLIAALLALLLLVRMAGNVRRGRLLRAGSCGVSSLAAGAIAAVAILTGTSYLTYEQLTAETDVAKISFIATGPATYRARLSMPGARDELFEIRGDEWQLDARIISWKPPLTVLGLQPIYRFDRLSGRFTEIARERSEARTVFAVGPEHPVDLWSLARSFPVLLPGIDAYYGSATYLPMADGASYTVSLSRDALKARPANAAGQRAVGDWRAGAAPPN